MRELRLIALRSAKIPSNANAVHSDACWDETQNLSVALGFCFRVPSAQFAAVFLARGIGKANSWVFAPKVRSFGLDAHVRNHSAP